MTKRQKDSYSYVTIFYFRQTKKPLKNWFAEVQDMSRFFPPILSENRQKTDRQKDRKTERKKHRETQKQTRTERQS